MPEYVYILSNPSFPKLYKVGYTSLSVEERMQSLYSTGVPTKFRLEFCIEVNDGYRAEQHLHKILQPHHYEKEFYRLSIEKLIEICKIELLKGEIDFIRYYGESNNAYLTPDEIQKIKEQVEEKKRKEEREAREHAEKLKQWELEKKQEEERLKILQDNFLLFTFRLNQIIKEKSIYFNTSLLGRFLNLDHFEDGIKISKTLNNNEIEMTLKLHEIIIEFEKTGGIPIKKFLSFEKQSYSLVLSTHQFHFHDKKNQRHEMIRYDGISQFFSGILKGLGVLKKVK